MLIYQLMFQISEKFRFVSASKSNRSRFSNYSPIFDVFSLIARAIIEVPNSGILLYGIWL